MEQKILVTCANGNVGFPTAHELLALGFQVRAFVRNPRSENAKKLKSLGAELFVGDQNDIHDLRKSLKGIQRAFFCAPSTNYHLSKTTAFVLAAEEEGLEHVVYLTQWLSSENHHSSHSREHWLADQVIKMHSDFSIHLYLKHWYCFELSGCRLWNPIRKNLGAHSMLCCQKCQCSRWKLS